MLDVQTKPETRSRDDSDGKSALSRRRLALGAIWAIAATCSAGCGGGSDEPMLPDAPSPDAREASPDAAPAVPDAPPACDPAPVDTRVHIELDTSNAEWVKSVKWLDTSSVLTPNLATFGAGPSCSGPNEQFGQLFGAPEGNQPYLVGGNTLATSTQCGPDVKIVSAPFTCDSTPAAQVPVTTEYHFYGGVQASQVRITRTIGFDATTPTYSGVGIRPYVPRVPISMFTTVIYPNGAGTAITSTATCFTDCLAGVDTKWNGKWIADIAPTSGLAMIVLRDPSMTSAVDFTVNNDSASGSNLSSFVLLQPTGGW
jgi:hypothetical protein